MLGIRIKRLDDITLGELMTLSPKTKEVQNHSGYTHVLVHTQKVDLSIPHPSNRPGQISDTGTGQDVS